MANTYTQIFVHFVFAVKNRLTIIKKDWENDLYKYINGIVIQQGNKPYIINGMPDHIHLLVSMRPDQAPSDLLYNIKRSSSLWINQNRLVLGNFNWQEGFGAFSCGKSQVSDVANYISNQKEHHKKEDFYEEYLQILAEYGVEYDEKYVFKPIEYK